LHSIAFCIRTFIVIVRTAKELGALIRERRKERGWSQSELALKVGVRRLWVSQFEAGKTTAHIGLVLRALRALDLELKVGAAPKSGASVASGMAVDLDFLLEGSPNSVTP
jgi:HTH-type transcriptional regulator/antitoxin HipB